VYTNIQPVVKPVCIRVRAVVWAYGRGQTDRQTDTQTRVTTIHFALSTTHAKCNNWKRLSVSRLSVPRCARNRRSPLLSSALWHTGHAHQQAASHASTDSAWRHPVWLPHSSLGFQRPVGRRSYHNKLACAALLRLTPQATIAIRAIVDCILKAT